MHLEHLLLHGESMPPCEEPLLCLHTQIRLKQILYKNNLSLAFFKKVQELDGHRAVLPFS